jgi:hypothetical protein
MTSALRYLLGRSLINGVVSRLKRLRQPKYLLAAALGGAYFYFYFYKFLFGGGFGSPVKVSGPSLVPAAAWPFLGAAILLVATLVFSWILPASRAAITFTEAEIAFLFPAPMSRRLLIAYKLLKSQLTFLFIAALMTLIMGRFRAGSEAWFRLGGWWIILNTLSMHRIGASFALQRLREWGMADSKRRLAVVIALAGLAALVEYTRRSLPELAPLLVGSGKTAPDIGGIITQIAGSGPLPYILAPFKWVVAPYFAHDAGAFLAALGPAFGIMVLHFLWVLRADVAFEEASIAASQKRAAFVAARHRGEFGSKSAKARTPLWRLRPTGFKPFAFLWKSLIKFGGRRALALWTLLFIILGSGAMLMLIYAHPGSKPPGWVITTATVVGIGCYVTVLISFVMVGQAATAQLRQGMASMDLMKTYPIPGWQLALGELSGPLLLGTLLQWVSLAVGAVIAASIAIAKGVESAGLIVAIAAAGLALLLPAFNVSMSVLPCAAALMFPGWFKPQDAAGQGLEATGLRLLVGIAQLAAMAVMLVPVAFFGACAWFVVGKWVSWFVWQAIAAGGVGALVLALESALGIVWLGSLYDDYDGTQA